MRGATTRLIRVLGGAAVLVVAAFLTSACGRDDQVRIGAKDFTEQELLAEMLAQLVEADGVDVERIIPVRPDRQALGLLLDGELDMYVEYTGTALALLGDPPSNDSEVAFRRAAELLDGESIELLDRLGFANDYVIAAAAPVAAEFDLRTISDLAELPRPPRFAIDADFARRPIDGFGALVDRYGIRQQEEPLVAEKPEIYERLLAGDVLVAQGFSTDSQIAAFDLVVLEDDLGFFPAYEAAPLADAAALEQVPALGRAAESLAGRLDDATIAELVRMVDQDGRELTEVARSALTALGLDAGPVSPPGSSDAVLAVGLDDELSGATGRAIAAVRAAYAGRTVTVVRDPDPVEMVLSGEARLAIVGAELVFDDAVRIERPTRDVESIASVETQAAHLVVAPGTDLGDVSTLAVGPPGSTSRRSATVLQELGALPAARLVTVEGGIDARVDAVRSAGTDGALVVAPPGHLGLARAIADEHVTLAPLDTDIGPEQRRSLPHLRPGVIPTSTYDGVLAVDTIYQQAVIVGAAPPDEALGTQGPGAGGEPGPRPPSGPVVRSIAEALAANPRIDPALPQSPELTREPEDDTRLSAPSPAVSIVNVVVLIGLAIIVVVFRRLPPRQHRPGG